MSQNNAVPDEGKKKPTGNWLQRGIAVLLGRAATRQPLRSIELEEGETHAAVKGTFGSAAVASYGGFNFRIQFDPESQQLLAGGRAEAVKIRAEIEKELAEGDEGGEEE